MVFVIIVVFMSNFQFSETVVTEEEEELSVTLNVGGSVPGLMDHMSSVVGEEPNFVSSAFTGVCLCVSKENQKHLVDLVEKKSEREWYINVFVGG